MLSDKWALGETVTWRSLTLGDEHIVPIGSLFVPVSWTIPHVLNSLEV